METRKPKPLEKKCIWTLSPSITLDTLQKTVMKILKLKNNANIWHFQKLKKLYSSSKCKKIERQEIHRKKIFVKHASGKDLVPNFIILLTHM